MDKDEIDNNRIIAAATSAPTPLLNAEESESLAPADQSVDVMTELSAIPFAPGYQPPADAPENPDQTTVILFKPITVNGKRLAEITLDFSRLSGNTAENIEDEMRAAGKIVPQNVALSTSYAMYVIARAGGLHIEDVHRMHMKDVMRATQAVQNFMLVSD